MFDPPAGCRFNRPGSTARPSDGLAEPGPRASRARPGAAILVVLGAIALLGAAAATGLGAVLHAQRAGRRASAAAAAFAAAEGARAGAMAEWHTRVPADLAVAAGVEWDSGSWNGAATAVAVTRIAPRVLRVEGRSVAPGPAGERPARRATAALWVVEPALLTVAAAFTAGAPIIAGPAAATGVRLDGRDTLLAGWSCAAADSASVPALATNAPVTLPPVSLVGGSAVDAGAPLAGRYVLTWPAPDTLRLVRPLVFAGDLTAPPAEPRLDGAGGCRTGTAEPTNWGDPARPSACAGWLPVVHVRGDLDGPVGRGQGVLVVDGDLTLRGGFDYRGVVIVGGVVRAGGAGNRVIGAILGRGDAAAGASHELDALALRYSSCVVRSALAAAGVLRPAPTRGWAEWW
ncbi:MAG: hypothetical protein ACYC2G_10265 [Gemmatimonadaceae bacterium]